jgi:hypothetical protein
MQEWQEKIEQRLSEVERKQQTEPIKVIIERQVEESPLLQSIYNEVGHLNTKVGTLEQKMEEVKADVLKIRESQGDFKGHLEAMATKEELRNELTAMEGRINNNITAMEERLTNTIQQLWKQRPSDDQEPQS